MTSMWRQMFDVSHLNLKCAHCRKEIKALPFQPSADRPIYCDDCVSNYLTVSIRGGSGFREYRF
ncbi:hypothetical protein HYR54_07805 [Candidatus Acetothermia bacterium]|nr:hypothetical protein [Candidatus Acetothermia bacterium]MBI3460210.1 hypothetical protein [Candidatus Acetothermia bacterium]